MTRVVQITDTHLSAGKRHFHGNWPPLLAWLEKARGELVIHTGDVTVDAAGEEADAAYCASVLREIRAPVLAVPGNHDVGDGPGTHQPVNDARLARWRTHFGEDRWFRDVDGWRLIGLDSQLCGSGHPEERRQLDWLAATMSQAEGRHIAWFLHKPLFVLEPDEGDTGYWSLKPPERAPILALARRHKVGLIASGHLHKWHRFQRDGIDYVWGPSSGFVCGPQAQPEWVPGENRLGAAIYEFTDAGVTIELRDVEGLTKYVIDDVVDEVYPKPAAA